MSTFLLSDAARMLREALKDRSYRATPLGLIVARYYRWKKNEWGATASTLRDYEAVLARLSLFYADLDISDLEPPIGTERVRECWDHHWGDRSPRTRAKVLSVFKDFFSWAVREGLLHGDPTTAITRPKQRDPDREVFSEVDIQRVLTLCARLRDRVALLLLFRCGLRKGELARIQFMHYDRERRRLKVFGKGGKVRYVPIVDEELRRDLESHILERQPAQDEFLLYPERTGPIHNAGPDAAPFGLLWEDKKKPMTSTTLHRWWVKRLETAGVTHQRMHSARHTAITDLVRSSGNLVLAQQLAGHADISTTANVYTHLTDDDLASALEVLYAERERRKLGEV